MLLKVRGRNCLALFTRALVGALCQRIIDSKLICMHGTICRHVAGAFLLHSRPRLLLETPLASTMVQTWSLLFTVVST